MSDWWTDAVGRADYLAFVRMMVNRYGSHANVVGYEVFNEPMVGNLGENHASTQAVISWEAPIVNTIRLKDPERAVFFMLRGGGDNGLTNADFTKFGPMTNLVLDLHDYYNGLYGSGYTPDQESWVPSWDATHNQNFLDYHGTEDALVQNLAVAVNKTRQLGIPLVVGEWGAQTADSGVLDFQHHLVSVMSRYGLSWARWNLGQGADPFTLLTRTKSFNLVGPTSPSLLRRPRRRWGSPRSPTSRHRCPASPRSGRCSRHRTAHGPACPRPSSPTSGSAATRSAWPARSSPAPPPRPTS